MGYRNAQTDPTAVPPRRQASNQVARFSPGLHHHPLPARNEWRGTRRESPEILARFAPLNRNAAFMPFQRCQDFGRRSGIKSLCEKRPKVKFLFKMEVQITLATNKNASYRICERWLFRQFVFHTGSKCR